MNHITKVTKQNVNVNNNNVIANTRIKSVLKSDTRRLNVQYERNQITCNYY